MKPLRTFHTFATLQQARDYRYLNGTGGWIFHPDVAGYECILFPPEMTPQDILRHRFTAGLSGKLIASQ